MELREPLLSATHRRHQEVMGLNRVREDLIFGGSVSPLTPIREHLPKGHGSEPKQEALSRPWRDRFEAVTGMHSVQPQALVHPAEDGT